MKKGITLVELVVIFAIIVVVFAAASSFLPFGYKINKKAEIRSELQSSVRLVSSRINELCRNRQGAVIISSVPASMGTFRYIYIKPSDTSAVVYYDGISENVIDRIDNGTYTINFSADNNILNYTITAQIGSESYQIKSSVEFVNMKTSITGTSGPVIRFDMP